MLFIWYPKCTTCQKAKRWLEEHHIAHDTRDIKTQPPTLAELTAWHQKSNLPLRRFFNTSGLLYRNMNLKDKLPTMTEQEQLELLASDGMLVKRPLLVADSFVLVGFKQPEWSAIL